LRALVGAHQLNQSIDIQSFEEISQVLSHESYNPQTLANDLALIKVKTQLNLDNSDDI